MSSHNTQSIVSHSSLPDLQSKSWQSNNSLESCYISLFNLLNIHNDKIDIFTKDNTILNIQDLESLIKEYSDNLRESNNQKYKLALDSLNSANTQIFLYSTLLTVALNLTTQQMLLWRARF